MIFALNQLGSLSLLLFFRQFDQNSNPSTAGNGFFVMLIL
jgi:hypothetical protein